MIRFFLGCLDRFSFEELNWASCNGVQMQWRNATRAIFFVYQSKPSKLMNVIFADFPIPTFDRIILWYCVQEQIFAICDFSMFRVTQWQGINIFSHLKICMNLDIFLIVINNYIICLWVFECWALEIRMLQVAMVQIFETQLGITFTIHILHPFQCP